MTAVATQALSVPSETQEGLRQIFQGIQHIRNILGTFESFAKSLDTLQESINGLVGAVNNVETALQQIGYMVVNIGTA
eukprot:3791890-Pyramimonas_sp.AAC.1